MVRAKRHNAIHRALRFRKRVIPFIVAKVVSNYLSNAKEMLAFWLAFLDVIEKATLDILNSYGINGTDVVKFLAYAKKLVRYGKISNFLTILVEYLNVLDLTIKRNPSFVDYQEILEEIQHQVSREIGQYIHLWYGFYDLAYYDISIYLE